MKLRYSATSPYVRKVLAMAIETGLDGQIERVATDPWSPETDLPESNPLGKVPALALEDGTVLFDSRVICEYLDSRHGGARLFPDGAGRWPALRMAAIGDGICDAAINRLLDTRRPETLRSPDWQARQKKTMARGCDVLEAEAESLNGPVTIGQLAVACALGYLDLRFGDDQWREGRPALSAWYEAFSQRPSIATTKPQ